MRSRPLTFLFLVIAAAAAYVYSTSAQLPEHIATHFGANNLPNGWMTRDGYRGYMLVLLVGLPALLTLLIGVLPRRLGGLGLNIPNRSYWLEPERREETLRTIADRGTWLACAVVLMIAAIHYLILEAHQSDPPRLPLSAFGWVIGGFLAFVLGWIVLLFRRFRSVADT